LVDTKRGVRYSNIHPIKAPVPMRSAMNGDIRAAQATHPEFSGLASLQRACTTHIPINIIQPLLAPPGQREEQQP